MIRYAKTLPQQGFTIVELTLSMAFIGFIVIFLVTTTIVVMQNYNKGLSIKEIDQTSRTIIEQISHNIRSTNASSINTSALANGRACFGSVSYVWNIQGNTTNRYLDNSVVTMATVDDPTGALCIANAGTYPSVDQTKATPLIATQMWVQAVQIALSPDQKLATVTLRLSTASPYHPTVNSPNGLVCAGDINGRYCAVSTFNTTVTTRNGG